MTFLDSARKTSSLLESKYPDHAGCQRALTHLRAMIRGIETDLAEIGLPAHLCYEELTAIKDLSPEVGRFCEALGRHLVLNPRARLPKLTFRSEGW
jgi:hypothetical protein